MVTELDDGKIYRTPLHLMVKTIVKTHGFPVDFPLNQSRGREVTTSPGAASGRGSCSGGVHEWYPLVLKHLYKWEVYGMI